MKFCLDRGIYHAFGIYREVQRYVVRRYNYSYTVSSGHITINHYDSTIIAMYGPG